MGSTAINSAISGLQADSTWLDVVGNNIANVNTVGYKSSTISFANQFSRSLTSGSGDNASSELGGVNAQQVGGGTRVQSIQTNFTAGVIQQTGVTTDLAIQGNGFLISKSGSNTYLTRAGNLNFDSQGYLVDSTGAMVQGYSSSLHYTTQVVNSGLNGAARMIVTNAAYQLDNSNASAIGNIQINPNMTLPPSPTTQITFTGNLDAAQQANSSGGILDLAPGGKPVLPIATAIQNIGFVNTIDTDRMQQVLLGGGDFALQQTANLSEQIGGQPVPLDNGIINLALVQLNAGNYAWEQQPPLPPSVQTSETIYDSVGLQHQITFQFYQVNDLGNGGINSASGPSQTCYAWYAFDTTGGQAVSTNNLIGGTGIAEGDVGALPSPPGPLVTYDRGTTANALNPVGYGGDFLYFNTDGSLASSGGIAGPPSPPGPPNFMSIPRIYIPISDPSQTSPIPTQGAQILGVDLNFGTFGVLGVGKRDGVTGDADGSYQTINGVNTYVPNSHLTESQDGVTSGVLQSVAFDDTGKIIGSFSNGKTTALGQVALANVNNEGGLTNVGANHFQTSVNSGAETIGQAGQNGLGSIAGSSLEGSNVELTTELTNMIIAQKGFDTNARMLTTMSTVLQTIAQLGQ